MSLKKTFEELKAIILHKDKKFSEAMDYFLSNLVENNAINKYHKPFKKDNEFYRALLTPVCDFLNSEINAIYLMHSKKYHFVHGVAILENGRSISLFFFEDIKVGLASTFLLSGQMDYFRLSAIATSKEANGEDIKKMIIPHDISTTLN